MATDVAVPALGESITEGTLAQWLKKPGEAVAADEPIATLETDKVSVDVPSPTAGVLSETLVNEGDTVAVGAVIARIDEQAAAGAEAPPTSSPAKEAADATTNPAGAGENPQLRGTEHAPEPAPNGDGDAITTLSPAVRRAVLEHHVDPSKIKGTGKDGRLTKDDVLAAAQAQQGGPVHEPEARAPAPQPSAAATPAPQPEAKAQAGERHEERVKMTRLRQTIARRLKEAQNTAAMLTTFNDVDMSEVMELRKRHKDAFEKKHGVKLGFMGFFVRACVAALKEIPSVNAEIDGGDIIYKNYYNVSVAVGTDKGLVVPVVRDADTMTLAEIEAEIGRLGALAREGKLSMDDLQGGTFTISNGGVYGSLMSTPILNPPQAGVLGMHRIEERPVVVEGKIIARPMMYLALSYDHRLVDGKEAVTFLVRVKEALEDPERLLLDL